MIALGTGPRAIPYEPHHPGKTSFRTLGLQRYLSPEVCLAVEWLGVDLWLRGRWHRELEHASPSKIAAADLGGIPIPVACEGYGHHSVLPDQWFGLSAVHAETQRQRRPLVSIHEG